MSSSPSDLADRQHGMAPSPEARLVAIAHPRDDIEAQLITNLLAEAGIEAMVTGGSLAGFRAEAPANVCVVVRAADAEAARETYTKLIQAASEENVSWIELLAQLSSSQARAPAVAVREAKGSQGRERQGLHRP